MEFLDYFYLDIKQIYLAHRYTLDRVHKCSYPKGRGSYGLIYALRGGAEYRFSSGERHHIAAGDFIFLSPDTVYSIAAEKEFDHYTVNFDLHKEDSRMDAMDRPYCILRGKSTESEALRFKKMIDLWNRKRAGDQMQAVGLLYELLSFFYFNYAEGESPVAYRRLDAAREYIEQHYAEPISLAQLASLSDMSVAHFRREWGRFYAETPIQYRDSVRLSYAKEYLQTGYYTVSEIAKKCGYEDVSYFIRFFKKKTGRTPGAAEKEFLGK